MRSWKYLLAALAVLYVADVAVYAQPPRRRPPPWQIEPTPETLRNVEELIEEVRDVELTINVQPNISRLIKTKRPITRISITDPSVMDVIQYSPTEFELVGLRRGMTSMSIWYARGSEPADEVRSSAPISPRRELAFRR